MEVTEVPFADTVGDRAGDSGDITALTKAQNKYFPKIKRWMERYFKTMEVSVNLKQMEIVSGIV